MSVVLSAPATFSRTRTRVLLWLALLLASPAGPMTASLALAQPATGTEAAPAEPPAQAIPDNPYEILLQMGYFSVPLVLASVIVVWFAIERAVVLRRGRVIPRPFVARFLQHLEQGKLDAPAALKLCEENKSPVADVFAHGLRKWGKPSVEVEQAIIDGGERQVGQMRKHLRMLNGIATIAPLLGLLGTVVGMIEAFNRIAGGTAMGKAEDLAGGIGLALLTTAAGLSIAIPALIIYMYLAGRVDALVMEMDLLAQRLVQVISAEALSERSRRAARTPDRPAPARSTAKGEASKAPQ